MRLARENPGIIPAASGIDPGNPMALPGQMGAAPPTAQPTNFQFPTIANQFTQ